MKYFEWSKVLDWPFLSFLIIVGIICVFRRELKDAVRCGNICIKWGDREIRIKDISGSIDEVLSPLREDVDDLKKAVSEFQNGVVASTLTPLLPSANETNLNDDVAVRKMRDALITGKFVWRGLERLAIIGGVSAEQAHRLLAAQDDVVLSKSKYGGIIARHAARSPS